MDDADLVKIEDDSMNQFIWGKECPKMVDMTFKNALPMYQVQNAVMMA